MRMFLLSSLILFGFNAKAETCVETFGRLYGEFIEYNETSYTCDATGNGTGIWEITDESVVWSGNWPYLIITSEVRNCATGGISATKIDGLQLCLGDHQSAVPPKKLFTVPTNMCGSIIKVEDQVVGESVPIVGSEISLNYFTSWVPGRVADYKVDIPFTGPSPSGDIPSGSISLSSEGSTIYSSGTLSGSIANQGYSYQYNPSSSTSGSKKFSSRTSYVHPRVGASPIVIGFNASFPLGAWRAEPVGPKGWVPSNYAYYDSQAGLIYFGDGSVRYETLPVVAGSAEPYRLFSEDGSKIYYFDTDGRLKYIKSGKQGTTLVAFVHGIYGLDEIRYPFSKKIIFNRNTSGKLTSITATNGQVTSVNVDSSGYLQSITNPNSEAYSFTYDSAGMLHTFTKPNGEVSTFAYNSLGHLIQDSHSGGYATSIARTIVDGANSTFELTTPMSRLSTITMEGDGENGRSTRINSDGTQVLRASSRNGLSHSTTFAEKGTTISEYLTEDARFKGFSSFGEAVGYSSGKGTVGFQNTINAVLADDSNPLSIVSWSEDRLIEGLTVSTLVYDPTLKKYLITSVMGKTNEVIVDSYDRPTSIKTGSLNTTSFNYTNEKVTSITQGTRTTTLGYDTADRISTVTNPLSQTTGYLYDLAGRVTSVVLPDSRTIAYGYNSNGALTSVTPPSRPMHIYGYNSSELLSSYQPPTLSGVSVVNTTYTYNNDKQLTGVTRPDGSSISFNYDSSTGFLTEFTTPEGTYIQVMDASTGYPIQVILPDGRSTYITYADGAVSQTQNYSSAGANIGGYTTQYQVLKISNDTVTGSGTSTSTINYLYNNDHELSKAGDVNISYHVPNGYMTGTTMGSGTTGFTDTYTYNTYGEVTGYQAKRGTTVLYDLTLTRDALGRVNGKTQTMNSLTDAFVYTFDTTGRLTQTDKNAVTAATYSYDSNSNRNGGVIGLQTTTATYDNQDRMLTFNTLSFTYNANGELTSKTNSTTSQTTTYTYDVFGNLRQVFIPPSTTITYDIDGLNRRIAKKVNGTVQKRWVYMDQYRIAAELNSSGAITKRFIYGSKANVPDYMIASGVKYRIISDNLGSPRLVVKQSDGTIMQRMNHDEYGRVTEDTNPGYLPFGFAGGVYDNQTSLVRFGARDYDPETGRWTSKDPILFGGGDLNLYGYLENDPVNWIDPLGLTKKRPGQVLDDNPLAGGGGGVGGSANVGITIKPNGQMVGQAGSSSRVRVMSGGLQEAQKMYSGLCRGGTPGTPSNYPGQMVRFSDGGTVGLRISSHSGPPTIDINVPGFQNIKIKFTGD